MNRRAFLKAAATGALLSGWKAATGANRPPNIVIILADDLGYGDLGCYGSTIRTPNLDRMAAEGVRFRQFYSASPVCSPARAALMTGRYAPRVGVPGVLFPTDRIGIPATETTLPQMLRSAGYRTACVGKWHLGSSGEFMPTGRGFDEFFGLTCSNDMFPRPLIANTDVLQPTADNNLLTQQFTQRALDFITRQKDSPFFLYLAHTAPHLPLGASPAFQGRSPLGPYGDAVEEIDWSTGEVLRTLKDNGLDDNTLVLFTSDNGPWYQGSKGPLRGRKGETYEGGVREPLIARLPGRIPANRVANGMATMLDLLPTLARISGAALPANPLDGVDVFDLMTGDADTVARDPFLYFDGWQLQCARVGKWKLHVSRYNTEPWVSNPAGRLNLPLKHPELYDLEADPGEEYEVSQQYPQTVADIRARIANLLPAFPAEVRNAWNDTMATAVDDTPAGARPVATSP